MTNIETILPMIVLSVGVGFCVLMAVMLILTARNMRHTNQIIMEMLK